MNISLKKLYAYSISLITLFMMIMALWTLAGAVIDFVYPTEYSPNEIIAGDVSETPTSEERIKPELAKRESIKDILKSILQIAIILPFYLFHWKLAKKTEKL